MQTIMRVAVAATVLVFPLSAAAQSGAVALRDPNPPRLEFWGHAGWLTVDKEAVAPRWNRWYDAGEFGLAGATFLTRHLKIDFGATTSTTASVYREVRLPVPNQTYTIGYSQDVRYHASTFSSGLSWQFLDNRWIHPVLGVGAEATRESEEAQAPGYPVPVPVPPGAFLPQRTVVTWRTRPYVSGGFKFYVSERAFVRTDLRTTFDDRGTSQVSWRTGVGLDF